MIRGLGAFGAVDCSAFSPEKLSRVQLDAVAGYILSMLNQPGAAAAQYLATVPAAMQLDCWAQRVNQVVSQRAPDSGLGMAAAAALKEQGLATPYSTAQLTPLLTALTAIFDLHSVEQVIKLAKCGAVITGLNGWARYQELWAESACMPRSWYENPWYLGGISAVVIGAVWFATRKKKAG